MPASRYVGETVDEAMEAIEFKTIRLAAQWRSQQAEAAKLDA